MFSLNIRKLITYSLQLTAIIALVAYASFAMASGEIDYYTCGMHPSVKILPKDYTKDTLCPICNMKLIPIYKEETLSDPLQNTEYYGCGMDKEGKCPCHDAGNPDAKCACGDHSFAFKGKKANCPVCNMPLKKLTKEEAGKLEGIIGRVRIKSEQARLAGVQTEAVKRLHLYKEIRTVGKVAYDPELAITQGEFTSALKALDNMKDGTIPEIRERTESLVESGKRRLRLLGLSIEQIEELEKTRKIQTSLILPEEKMWIYGNVYEYELPWLKQGEKVRVTTSSLPGEEFSGTIASINPVLDSKTRSIKFRAEVDNPDLKLKPEMYVDVVISSMYVSPKGEHMVLAIPRDAILDTGMRKVAWVDMQDGTYEGREVEVGPEASIQDGDKIKYYPVLKGLNEKELVVTKANFLIDSQSQITGVAAAAYGGALGADDKSNKAPGHQH